MIQQKRWKRSEHKLRFHVEAQPKLRIVLIIVLSYIIVQPIPLFIHTM